MGYSMPYRAVRVTLIGPVTAGMCISNVFGQHPCVGHVPVWYPLSQASVRAAAIRVAFFHIVGSLTLHPMKDPPTHFGAAAH